MSGIAGIYNLNAEPIEPELLRKMAGAMKYHGPDGTRVWHDGPIGLVHRHFWTTPEDAGEKQPICSVAGRYWIAADARIDNREELIPLLKTRGYLDKTTPTDAEVILSAYEYWGEGCAQQLIGDFSFAIWDAEVRHLFLARDVMGIRQLYYAVMDGVLYFGTTIGAVLAALPRRPALNSRLIEEYLRASYDLWICQTVYSGLLRLPPAHLMTVNGKGLFRRLYYVLGSQPGPSCSSDKEWIETFRVLLDEAIRCRLRSTTPVGILVSGGLDSSSLACAAHELIQKDVNLPEIRLYSAVYEDTPGADEREYFDAVAAKCAGFVSNRIVSDQFWALREFGTDNNYPLDEPELYTLRSYTLSLLRVPASDGCRVVIWGEGGDQALGQHLYHTPAALRGVGLRNWLAEIRHFREKSRRSWIELILRAYVQPFLPGGLQNWLKALRFRRAQLLLWVKCINKVSVSDGFSLDRAFTAPPGLKPSAQAVHWPLRSAYNIARYSALNVMMAYAGVEWRLPYLDRRVVDFLLHIPHHLRSWRGIDRIILREGMIDTLPESVRFRLHKSPLTELVHRGLREEERQRVEELLWEPRAEALGFIDAMPLHEAFEDYWQCLTDDFQPLKKPLCLEAWLRDRVQHN